MKRVTSFQKYGRPRLPMLLCSIILAALMGCGGQPGAAPPAPERVSGLRIKAVRRENVASEIEAPGTVTSVRTAPISARTMGTVQQVLVREGENVKAGQLLVQLDEREMTLRQSSARAAVEEAAAAGEEAARTLASAQAQAEIAQKTLDRFRMLREKNAVAPHKMAKTSTGVIPAGR